MIGSANYGDEPGEPESLQWRRWVLRHPSSLETVDYSFFLEYPQARYRMGDQGTTLNRAGGVVFKMTIDTSSEPMNDIKSVRIEI